MDIISKIKPGTLVRVMFFDEFYQNDIDYFFDNPDTDESFLEENVEIGDLGLLDRTWIALADAGETHLIPNEQYVYVPFGYKTILVSSFESEKDVWCMVLFKTKTVWVRRSSLIPICRKKT